MENCRQACPYNTLDGCKAKEYNAICPLTNMATPVTEYRTTNADKIRSMTDEELANWLARTQYANMMEAAEIFGTKLPFKEETLKGSEKECLEWLQQPADEG